MNDLDGVPTLLKPFDPASAEGKSAGKERGDGPPGGMSPETLAPGTGWLLLFVGVAGLLLVLATSAMREAQKQYAYDQATYVYGGAVRQLDTLFRKDSRGKVLDSLYISLTSVNAKRDAVGLWKWANRASTATRRLALAATRVAAAASDVEPDSSVTVDLALGAQILLGNSGSIMQSVEDLRPATQLDDELRTQNDTIIDNSQLSGDSSRAAAASINRRRRSSSVASAPSAKRGLALRGPTPELAQHRLELVLTQVREQYSIGADFTRHAASLRSSSAPNEWRNRVPRFIVGDVTVTVLRTLAIGSGVALLLLAIGVPAMHFLARRGIVGGRTLEPFKPYEFAPLALAALPLLATPFLIASVSGSSPVSSDIGHSRGGAVTLSSTDPAMAAAYSALAVAIEQSTLEDQDARREIFAALSKRQSDLSRRVETATLQLAELRKTYTKSELASQRVLDSFAANEANAARRHDDLTRLVISSANDLNGRILTMHASAQNLVKTLQVPITGMAAQAWLTECLRLEDSRRAAPLRFVSSLFGNRKAGRVMDEMPDVSGDRILPFATKICGNDSVMTAEALNGTRIANH